MGHMLFIVPASEWKTTEKGAKKVDVRGLDDKREKNILLTLTMAGQLLPPQVIYYGKTKKCHTK